MVTAVRLTKMDAKNSSAVELIPRAWTLLGQWTRPLDSLNPKASGCVYVVEVIQGGGISSTADEFLASIFVHHTMVTTVAKYDQRFQQPSVLQDTAIPKTIMVPLIFVQRPLLLECIMVFYIPICTKET